MPAGVRKQHLARIRGFSVARFWHGATRPGTISNNPTQQFCDLKITAYLSIAKSFVIRTSSGANQILHALDLVFMTPFASAKPAAAKNTWSKVNCDLLPQCL